MARSRSTTRSASAVLDSPGARNGAPGRLGSRRQPEATRAAILDSAGREFAHEGVAGARTDAIARAAGVNKALLYYYFKDKEALYGAVIDRVFAGLLERVTAVLDGPLPPREKMLQYVGTHFDYIAQAPVNPRLIQQEMMRGGRHASPHIRRVVKNYFVPLFGRLGRLIREGIQTGDFREVDPRQFVPSMIAVIVFYFSNTPVLRLMLPGDPLSPERLAARRVAVLDFIASALFQGEENGPRERPAGPAGETLRHRSGQVLALHTPKGAIR